MKKLENLEYSPNFPNFHVPRLEMEMDKHHEVAICPYQNFEKFGKLESLESIMESLESMLLLLEPLRRFTVL